MSEGIGARLRSARERSRLTIMQAAERLHVDPDVLEALEAENFAALGAPVYVKGHLRHYAELVGESAEALFDLYSQGTRVPQPDLTRIPKALPDDASRFMAPAVLALIGFVLAGALWWGLSLSRRQWSTVAARPMPVSPAPAAAPPSPAADMPVVAVASTALPTSSAPAPTVHAAPRGPLVAHGQPVPQGQIGIVLSYSAVSWTEVYDATGRRLLYGLANAPSTHKLEGVPPLNLFLGDASGVAIQVGGRATSFARFTRADHTARFLIAADGHLLAAPRKKGG